MSQNVSNQLPTHSAQHPGGLISQVRYTESLNTFLSRLIYPRCGYACGIHMSYSCGGHRSWRSTIITHYLSQNVSNQLQNVSNQLPTHSAQHPGGLIYQVRYTESLNTFLSRLIYPRCGYACGIRMSYSCGGHRRWRSTIITHYLSQNVSNQLPTHSAQHPGGLISQVRYTESLNNFLSRLIYPRCGYACGIHMSYSCGGHRSWRSTIIT